MTAAADGPAGSAAVLEPFGRPEWQADLAELSQSYRAGWQAWAAEAVLLSRLAAQVPGNRHDVAWKSFVREVAVARRCSDQAAGKDIYIAVALTRSHPRTLALVQVGLMPRWNAQALVEESVGLSPAALAEVEAELAERACGLTPSRIRDAVRKIELRYDGDAAAAREATATASRGVQLTAQPDGQADLVLSGPALPVVAFYEALTAAARAAKAAGDPRGLNALRFDLALDLPAPNASGGPAEESVDNTDPATDPNHDVDPTDNTSTSTSTSTGSTTDAAPDAPSTAAPGVRPVWLGDRRRVRPVQAMIHLPVTTALGLDNEPGWLAGYGWVSAPRCRQWLTSAELRQVCVNAVGPDAGTVVDLADQVIRPTPTPAGIREALLDMVADPGPVTDKTWRVEPRHDPSPTLGGFVDVRDGFCDGPTGARAPATSCHRDHDLPYPDGPTAAWNLTNRAGRTHLLKHGGWTATRTPTGTTWTSPAGQTIHIDRQSDPPPGIDPRAQLPDPDQLHHVDSDMTREPAPVEATPWHPAGWDDPPPF